MLVKACRSEGIRARDFILIWVCYKFVANLGGESSNVDGLPKVIYLANGGIRAYQTPRVNVVSLNSKFFADIFSDFQYLSITHIFPCYFN